MGALSSSNSSWLKLLAKVSEDFRQFSFQPGPAFMFSAENKTIYYNTKQPMPRRAWSLLHELSHAELEHESYVTDFELLKMEVHAWSNAKKLAKKYDVNIDEDHIQNCLDSYRDWLHRRSTCPTCDIRTVQISETTYQCHNCATKWTVTNERFSRPYRRIKQKTPLN